MYISKVRISSELTSTFLLALGATGDAAVKESVFSVQECTVEWDVRNKVQWSLVRW